VIECVVLLDPCWIPEESLRSWQRQNYPWLELSEVHRQTTKDIRVTVTPFYMGTRVSIERLHCIWGLGLVLREYTVYGD